MKNRSYKVRSVAAAAIMGLTLTTSALGVPAALAADSTTTTAPASLMDPSKDGQASLTIHKFANPESEGTPTGNVGDATGNGTAVSAGFTIWKITGIDIKTNEGLKAAAQLKASDFTISGSGASATATYNGTIPGVGVEKVGTEHNGSEITFGGLDLAAYLVSETTAPAAVSNPDGSVTTYAAASNFIAFVPMTQNNATTGGTEWNYDVHAFPKNYSNQAEKEVEDTNAQVGDNVTFTVSGEVPRNLDPTNGLTKFSFVDKLDSKVSYVADTATVKVLGSDGTVLGTLDAADYTVTNESNTLTVTLTDAGLAKFNSSWKTTGKKIVLTFDVTVNQAGELTNTADVVSNNGSGSGDTTTKTNTTKSYWAKVNIVKQAADDQTKKLAGAEFQVYGSLDDTCTDADLVDGNKISTKSGTDAAVTDTWTTDSNGQVTINGLHVNNWDDNSTVSDEQYKAYCLVETKAPAGYELLAQPIKLTLNRTPETDFTGTANNAAAVSVDATNFELTATIDNLKDTTPNLPLTGGAGVGILAALGAAIVALGAWFARRSAKNS
ncbi:SpaH/EbpB family LPXTG-anchored major pilin [Corynebacterium vitaeruminis]|uniref:Putative surface-anchored fimbrial subunit n=1 Tax=Corynebacterium vitaeruminis DSM 20294 TaxID=1224164 RepID=W5Y4A0_9CORY|nr:SpaH/EbpB family LPXTG-anchored major pilin [Corynebacterium vitaeruminis]AHI23690.1 putative surface-anchored fimbrial subunit [Corynebacterium vitaeruminis DSM 20294]